MLPPCFPLECVYIWLRVPRWRGLSGWDVVSGRTRIYKVLLFSNPRLNGMLASPRRPTIEKMASRKSSALHAVHRRMVVSMPNLQDIAVPELLARNSSLRKVDSTGCGSVGDTPAPVWGTVSRHPALMSLTVAEPVSVQGSGAGFFLFLAV